MDGLFSAFVFASLLISTFAWPIKENGALKGMVNRIDVNINGNSKLYVLQL